MGTHSIIKFWKFFSHPMTFVIQFVKPKVRGTWNKWRVLNYHHQSEVYSFDLFFSLRNILVDCLYNILIIKLVIITNLVNCLLSSCTSISVLLYWFNSARIATCTMDQHADFRNIEHEPLEFKLAVSVTIIPKNRKLTSQQTSPQMASSSLVA